ncbi:alpha/beta hydrolase [Noviherbaspirillum saxi]|uniref:Alpha/beta hydrolase n=1 Tax=Noviherbaspirillum saxi TaxID=2320863 RepID=A0A3A3FGE5_9BURK|nr:alpha/beta hydrolase [Noviherbaspirillum saxi]RJF92250.1 alpha/beta hydrolase [Noviherbaspirillum saxi]
MEKEIIQALRAIGTTLSPETIGATVKLLASHAIRPENSNLIERDHMYGPHVRHRLDVFRPDAVTTRRRPAFVFVHGGGFIGGDKGTSDAPFYSNVGAWAAKQGWVGVTLTYRLAPEFKWPAGSDDLETAIDWLTDHGETFGIDPAQIILCGQSAGATHVAGYVTRPRAAQTLAGAIMLSGIYDLVNDDTSPMETAYYGKDMNSYAAASTCTALPMLSIPCLYSVSEMDPPKFQRQAAALVQAHITSNKTWPRLEYLRGHNHLSPVQLLGTDGDYVGSLIASFVNEVLELTPLAFPQQRKKVTRP